MGINAWDRNRGKIYAQKGGWEVGVCVHNQGFDHLCGLVGNVSYFQILVFNVTARMVDRNVVDWIEAVFGCLSWPDHRIWCNQMGSLAGTMRASMIAGVTGGILASDSISYGVLPLLEGAEFTQRAMEKYRNGESIGDILNQESRKPGIKPIIVGYARPIATGDERVPMLDRLMDELNIERGEHYRLVLEIDRFMFDKYEETMNVNAQINAFMLDQGFSPEEIYEVFAILVSAGVQACYVESRKNPPGTFFPLQCQDIDYQGVAPRILNKRG